jgi:dephospho-CoA kinase
MIVIGLTGGIGSGKSTVSEQLVAREAILIDADAVVKEMQEPGQEVHGDMVARFGEGIVDDDGALVRPAIAEIVFSDKQALKDLNRIVHPPVNREIRRRIREQVDTDNLVVLDIPLLVEGILAGGPPRYIVSGILVVDTPADAAIDRLVEHRGFAREDAEKRIKAQVSREQRLALADFVVDNSGDLSSMPKQIDRALKWAMGLPDTEPTPEPPEDA